MDLISRVVERDPVADLRDSDVLDPVQKIIRLIFNILAAAMWAGICQESSNFNVFLFCVNGPVLLVVGIS